MLECLIPFRIRHFIYPLFLQNETFRDQLKNTFIGTVIIFRTFPFIEKNSVIC